PPRAALRPNPLRCAACGVEDGRMLKPLPLVVCALALLHQPGPSRFEMRKLADGVYAAIRKEPVGLGVDANNLFIVDDDGVVVVDTNFGATSTREVVSALRALTDQPGKYVINTRPADDHVLGQ